jgi:hydrogenase nickel incorporation protein HypA/HybF
MVANAKRDMSMHEVGLMEQALQAAQEAAGRAGASRIHRLILHVGAISGVEPEALRLAFAALAPGTAAAEAQLTIVVVPVACKCPSCEMKFTPTDIVYLCPSCGALSGDVVHGRDLELDSVEVS